MNLRELVIRLMKGEEPEKIELERVEACNEEREEYRSEESAHELEKAETRKVETPKNNIQTHLHETPPIVDTSLVEKYITETRKLLENTKHITTTSTEELEKIEKTLTELAKQVTKQVKQLTTLLTEINTELIKIVQLRQVLTVREEKPQTKTRH